MTLVTKCNNDTPGRNIQYCNGVYCHKQRQEFVKNFYAGLMPQMVVAECHTVKTLLK